MNPIVGALVGGAIDVGKSVVNNHFSDKAAHEQYRRQMSMWELQNDYNQPLNQAMRLKQAGLNPNLMYQSGQIHNQSGSFSQAPANEYAKQGAVNLQNLDMMMQLGVLQSEINLKNAQAGVADAQATTLKSQAKINDVTERFLSETFDLRKYGIQLDNNLKIAHERRDNVASDDTEATRSVRIKAMESQIQEAYAQAYKLKKSGKLDEAKTREVDTIIRKMRVELNILKRQDSFEKSNGNAPLAMLTRNGLFGSGLTVQNALQTGEGLFNKIKSWFK